MYENMPPTRLSSRCRRLLVLLALVAAGGMSIAPACAQTSAPAPALPTVKSVEINRAAKIVLMEGDVRVLDGTRKRRAVALGDAINEGDFIVTGTDGELQLDMEDGGYLAVRPNTRMRIAKYQANGDENDTGGFGLLQGSFRSVSGWIGKFNRNNYLVRT